jgi:hypothetical protein
LCAEFVTSNNWMPPPHTLQLPRASSPTSLRTRLPTPSWLLSLIIERQPPKARAWCISLFFDVSSFGAPNRWTSHPVAKPDHRRLAWDHREPRHHWLGAPVFCPWRERATPVEGRVAAAHFGCCVLCCLLWLWQARFATLLVEKVEIGPAKMANFSAFITKNASLDAPNVNGWPKSPSPLDFSHVLTFGLKRDIGELWVRKKCVIFYLGRAPSYFFHFEAWFLLGR